jgi:hypothetical protein
MSGDWLGITNPSPGARVVRGCRKASRKACGGGGRRRRRPGVLLSTSCRVPCHSVREYIIGPTVRLLGQFDIDDVETYPG